MERLPKRVFDTVKGNFYELNNAKARGEVIDMGFACVSYIWKEEGEDQGKPVINGEVYPTPDSVKRNIANVISYAAHVGIQYVWIDALCIDQTDDEDIQEEISKMHVYFTTCNLVIVWTAKKRFVAKSMKQKPRLAIQQLYNSEWLNRSWTIQEGVLASRLVVATDWGLMFPDALYQQNILDEGKPHEPPPGFSTLLKSRHRRAMLGYEVLELAQNRNALLNTDRVKSLTAMLPYTISMKFSDISNIRTMENDYLNSVFAGKDLSPLLFMNMSRDRNRRNSGYSWKPDFASCCFPANMKICMHDNSVVPKITKAGLRINVKVVKCDYNARNLTHIRWDKDFPEGREYFGAHSKVVNTSTNGVFKFSDYKIQEQMVLFISKDMNQDVLQQLISRMGIIVVEYHTKKHTQCVAIFDDSLMCYNENTSIVLPGVVANGCELGLLVVEDDRGIYYRIGLCIMSQLVALQMMSSALTQINVR